MSTNYHSKMYKIVMKLFALENRGKPNNEEKTVEQPLFIAPTEEELCTDAINAEVVNEAYFYYDQSKFGKQAEEASDSDSSDSEGGGLHVVRGRKVGSGANNDFMPGSSGTRICCKSERWIWSRDL